MWKYLTNEQTVRFWTSLSSLATVFLCLAAGVTAVIYLSQLRAMTKSRQLEAILAIFRYLDAPEFRMTRWFLYEHGATFNSLLNQKFTPGHQRYIDGRIRELSGETIDLLKINTLAHALDNIAFLLKNDSSLYKVAVPGMLENLFSSSAKLLSRYIDYRRLDDNRLTAYSEQRFADTAQHEIVKRRPSQFCDHLLWIARSLSATIEHIPRQE
jgi:hypothetical protein